MGLLGAVALGVALGPQAWATPQPRPSEAPARASSPQDAFALGVAGLPQPPLAIAALRATLRGWGGRLIPHLVANEGRHHPASGSFSAFEAYEGPSPAGEMQPGMLFIGWFMGREGERLVALEGPEAGLVVEVMAWDPKAEAYSYWELIGRGGTLAWHFRAQGPELLQEGLAVAPGLGGANRYGSGPRCTGCHTLGGPVMKELEGPHNDWWRAARPLPLGGARLWPGSLPAEAFSHAADASAFARRVQAGMRRWARAPQGPASLPWPQALRSLVGPMEFNLVSDAAPNEAQAPELLIPAACFVDPFLAPNAPPIRLPRPAYEAACRAAGLAFGPDGAASSPDGDHAFLAPVRSRMDAEVVQALIAQGRVDEEFVGDLLAIDLAEPLHSQARLSLLRHLPAEAKDLRALKAKLLPALRAAPDPASQAWLRHLTEPRATLQAHRARARAFLAKLQAQAWRPGTAEAWLRVLMSRRAELRVAQPTLHAKGTILEPGFRVIFPRPSASPVAGAWRFREADAEVVPGP